MSYLSGPLPAEGEYELSRVFLTEVGPFEAAEEARLGTRSEWFSAFNAGNQWSRTE